ncbi:MULTISPECIES: DUF7079 family protein [Xanthomonas]|uniref:DUF7079 family protein n=1 Tax=Xanthomonas TaxID=338 RepID=UPI0013DDC4AF|nr:MULTISPECIES: hypothetical protein [Xanthomonas]
MSPPTPAQRRVWEAMAELYLDTAVDDMHARIVRCLAESPFSLEQLRTMLLHEVHPVLRSNVYSVAGVWDGFDPAWLSAAIAAHRARAWRWPDRWCWRGYARAQWRWLGPRVAALRAETAAT